MRGGVVDGGVAVHADAALRPVVDAHIVEMAAVVIVIVIVTSFC